MKSRQRGAGGLPPEGGDGDEAASASLLPVGEEEVGAAGGAEARIGDALRQHSHRRQLGLVGSPEIKSPLPVNAGGGPALPFSGMSRAERIDHRASHLVTARADGGGDGGDEISGPRPFTNQRCGGDARRSLHSAAPSHVGHCQEPAPRIEQDDPKTVGCEDGKRQARRPGEKDVSRSREAAAVTIHQRDITAVHLAEKDGPGEVQPKWGEKGMGGRAERGNRIGG